MQRKLSYAEQVQWLEDYLELNGDELPTCDARLKKDVADFMDSCRQAGDVEGFHELEMEIGPFEAQVSAHVEASLSLEEEGTVRRELSLRIEDLTMNLIETPAI